MNIPFKKEQAQPQPLFVRFLFSLALGTLASVLGAAFYGLAGYLFGGYYLIIPVLVGAAVAAAVILPLRPVQKRIALLFLFPAILATLLSILLGGMLYVVLILMRDSGATLGEAVLTVTESLGETPSAFGMILGSILGLIGAGIGFFSVWRRL